MVSSDKNGDMVLIWTFNSEVQAEQAKYLLESHGYFAHINNSYSSQFNSYEAIVNAATGTIRLFTKQSQAYDAYVLLAIHDFVPMKDIMTNSSSGIDNFQKLMGKIPLFKSVGLLLQLILVGVFITLVLLLVFKS